MAIGFARFGFVQRSAGKNACCKAAYYARDKVQFEDTSFAEAKIYDWSHREKPAYHAICLPVHVNAKFKSMETLWNAAEQKENRHNSQIAMEMVMALPDDQVISLEDKIELVQTFINEHFVKNGLAVQIDIHRPDQKILLSPETGEIENLDHNWHAHLLLTTRRFKESGLELEDGKARDLMPVIYGGKVVAGLNWGQLWAQHQNLFFEEKGLDLRVDENGVVAQLHLGPVRMRGRAFALESENQLLAELNRVDSTEPEKVLAKITETRSVFSMQDVERFLHKHVEPHLIDQVDQAFWQQKDLVQLLDANTKQPLVKFTTKQILEEEKQIVRLADKLHALPAAKLKNQSYEQFTAHLNTEQKQAFSHLIQGQKLSCLEGHAGTGKSHLLAALREGYQREGYTVRALGPDNATADVLKEKGFQSAENIYQFLFAVHYDKRPLTKGKEIWFVDETSKLGNKPLLELLKAAEKYQAQILFAGCSSQLPSVERGGLFKFFCERYSAQELSEIQRQKKQAQLEMTKNLAHGKMAAAIDQLMKLGGIKWQATKEEAMERLIKTWAADQSAFPHSQALILAHSNAEVRLLNEMARLYRKEKGELEEEEYICKTAHGKMTVSVGDRLEFRKNDKKLGITNGMKGTLIFASPEKFVVKIEKRLMTFNPVEYKSFQLGYASTYFRSQGQTVERAYVLHSPQMNKEKFYVGLTRHVQKATLFVARTDASCLTDLKRQAFRKNSKENTLQYTTEMEVHQQKALMAKEEKIEQLKGSPSLLDKVKGYTLDVWDSAKNQLQQHWQHRQDIRPNQEFFSPHLKSDIEKGLVAKVDSSSPYPDLSLSIDLQKNFRKILERLEPVYTLPSSPVTISSNWKNLTESNQALLNQYYQTVTQAANLHAIVQVEADGKNLKSASHFKEWQKLCATRNTHAYQVLTSIPSAFIEQAVGKEAFKILEERSLKHQEALQRQNSRPDSLSDQLKEQIDALLYRLFPEGPTGRDAQGLRFGTKGSLAVACRGSRLGSFYDFEKGEGGGPLQLIEQTLNLKAKEAREWAREFLGQPQQIKLPLPFDFKRTATKTRPEWTSLKPLVSHPAPDLKQLSKALDQAYKEVARHAYKDEKGELLFYVLRLVSKQNPQEKAIYPLSYGQWQGANQPSWSFKLYQTEQRPLYGLDQLKNYAKSTILLVEGEKTADAAQKLLGDRNILCMTWQGGAAAVSKTDWMPLHGKEIVIWPDNDEAGFKAAERLCTELRKVGVQALRVVNPERLAKEFSPKWDLADPLPVGKNLQHLHDLILTSKEKTLGIEQLHLFVQDRTNIGEKLKMQELLWCLEEREWSKLEARYASEPWRIKQEIFNGMQQLIAEQKTLERIFEKDQCLSFHLANRLAQQGILFQAQQGRALGLDQIKEITQLTTHFPYQEGNLNHKEHAIRMHAADKLVTEAFSLGFSPEILKKIQETHTHQVVKQAAFYEAQELNLDNEQIKQKQQDLNFNY